MLLAFVAGWILGSIALYSYMILTAKETSFPECMDCRKTDCKDCPKTISDDGRIRLAA